MSVILAIETATASCSVALRINGEVVVRSEVGNNIHSRVLLSMVESLLLESQLKAQDIDAVAVGQGPGSFTGLRIGVGVGQGLAFGASSPMIGVSSLDALALQAHGDGAVVAAIDARMGEVYWCEYQKKGLELNRSTPLQVTEPEMVSSSARDVVVVGNAWLAYPERFSSLAPLQADQTRTIAQNSAVYPSAGDLLRLAEGKYSRGEWVCAAEFAPIYVRDDVAKKSTKPLPGRRPAI
jgi:tRNA threonylcarbamoyladenosine biosynthesis protein TsaB